MFMRSIFERGALPATKKMLAFTEERHRVLLNNIANIETPYYREQDLPTGEFQSMLKGALEDQQKYHPREFGMTGTWHIEVDALGKMRIEEQKTQESTHMRRIENNVSLERNMSELAKNNILHNVFNSLLVKQYKSLEIAIQGRA